MKFTKCICHGMTPGKTATLTGSVDCGAQRFAVDFMQGNDIAFHLNLRFDEKTIVCNNFSSGTWCSEVRHCLHSLEDDKPFKITVTCTMEGYEVVITGQHPFTFQHRVTDFSLIKTLIVSGDMTLTSLDIV